MSKSKSIVNFNAELFEARLENLKDTQDGIQQLSAWCLQQRHHHKQIVTSWLNVLKKVRVEHRLTLFYLANDVIQYSKRKRYEFVESWATALQRATTMVRDEKVKGKIVRIFSIWEQRDIYSEEYLSDLNGLLSMIPSKKPHQPPPDVVADDFQSSTLITNVRDCVQYASNTDRSFKNLPRTPQCDTEVIKNTLKEKSNSDDIEIEMNGFVAALKMYISNLSSEIESRKTLILNIDKANTFFTSQRGEVKVVVNAYKNFGNRIKLVKKKLDEITPELPSPMPSPDINAPSPEPDADISLPEEKLSFNAFNDGNGFSSYMDGSLPFDINDFKSESRNSQPIQVIGNRSEDNRSDAFTADFYKPRDMYLLNNGGPLPVPPVRSEYSSLAHSAAPSYNSSHVSYGNTSYNPINNSYLGDSSYISNSSNNSFEGALPLMPPPPMPPSLAAPPAGDFNSTWDMDMTWTSMDSSNSFDNSIETPTSPPHFEREGHNSNLIEYVENSNGDVISLQDVDHRQLHIPPAGISKLPLKKSRIVDIDHRNLIALTGSPKTCEETETKQKKISRVWIKDNNTDKPISQQANQDMSVNDINSTKHKGQSPIKGTRKDDTGYDPSDIVESIDMEMSDDDMEDLFREIANATQDPEPVECHRLEFDNELEEQSISPEFGNKTIDSTENDQYSRESNAVDNDVSEPSEISLPISNTRQALLETPEYQPDANPWDCNNKDPNDLLVSGDNISGNGHALNQNPFMSTPRMQFTSHNQANHQQRPFYQQRHQQQQQFAFPRAPFSGPAHRNFSPNQNFRGTGRSPRGQPYFNHNRGRGTISNSPIMTRPSFRGRFRNNNSW